MTKTMTAWIIAVAIAVALAISMKLSAQAHEEQSCQSQEAVFTNFNPGGQAGSFSLRINPENTITGSYTNFANHGFLPAHDGTFTEFDAPGAGAGPPSPLTGQPQGTTPISINPEGAITGHYNDANNVSHGFISASDGTTTLNIDAQRRGHHTPDHQSRGGDRGTLP
jgi:hypothetical protein